MSAVGAARALIDIDDDLCTFITALYRKTIAAGRNLYRDLQNLAKIIAADLKFPQFEFTEHSRQSKDCGFAVHQTVYGNLQFPSGFYCQ